MRILVTNDQGILRPGLVALVAALDEQGYDVIAVAPVDDRSGSSAAIGSLQGLPAVRYMQIHLPGLGHVPAYGVEGPPALAVTSACLGGFGSPPELVVSGVNEGANTGRAILHSGTVGAALTAYNLGRSALALSLTSGPEWHFATAAAVGCSILNWIAVSARPTVLNVNVPNVSLRSLRGVRTASLATEGTVQVGFAPGGAGRLQLEFRQPDMAPADGTDTHRVASGYVAVTQLSSVCDAPSVGVDALPALVEDELVRMVRATR
ncbi:MAG: 5'/3'-nucleotidase SurE [Acidimicrobiales bacterium]